MLSQKDGLLGRLRRNVPNEMLKIVYQTCVERTIDYCIVYGLMCIYLHVFICYYAPRENTNNVTDPPSINI